MSQTLSEVEWELVESVETAVKILSAHIREIRGKKGSEIQFNRNHSRNRQHSNTLRMISR